MTVCTKEDLNTSELIEKLVNQRRSFAITSISQKKDSEPNYIALIQNFKDELREGDFEYSEFTGKWIEDGKYVEKTSLLWADINERQACKLGNHYKRCSIFYKDVKEIREICTYPFLKGDKEYKSGDIIRTLPINFKIPLNMEFVKTIFAERNISNELKDFSLYEKSLINTRIGVAVYKIQLEWMLLTRGELMNRCCFLGHRFIEYFDKIYNESRDFDTIHQWASKMQTFYDEMNNIIIKESTKRLSGSERKDVFYSYGSTYEGYFNNNQNEIDLYEELIDSLEMTHNVYQSIQEMYCWHVFRSRYIKY